MKPMAAVFLAICITFTVAAGAQPTLSSLWPNEDGKRWEFQYTNVSVTGIPFNSPAVLQLEDVIGTAGGTAQILLGWHDSPPIKAGEPVDLSPLHRAVWRARPDLRAAIEQHYAKSPATTRWSPLLLHDGYFMKRTANIRMWQPDWDHATWTYLTADLYAGATFTHQLVPELASDVYLHGTVSSIDAAVNTPFGPFNGAVKVTYLIDYGVLADADENGTVLGHHHAETRGHVHYVPEVGPVEMLEEYIPYVWIDCSPGECPPDWVTRLGLVAETQTLALTSLPVSGEMRSWGGIKALFR